MRVIDESMDRINDFRIILLTMMAMTESIMQINLFVIVLLVSSVPCVYVNVDKRVSAFPFITSNNGSYISNVHVVSLSRFVSRDCACNGRHNWHGMESNDTTTNA